MSAAADNPGDFTPEPPPARVVGKEPSYPTARDHLRMFSLRAAAHLLDSLVVYGAFAGAGRVIEVYNLSGPGISPVLAFFAPQVMFRVAWFLYAGAMYSLCGATVGKLVMSLRVIDPAGNPPGFVRGGLRDSIGKWFSQSVCGLGCLWMLGDAERRTWHDMLFRTRVVRRVELLRGDVT